VSPSLPARVAALVGAALSAVPASVLAQAAIPQQLVVTASRVPQLPDALPFGVSVITAEDLEAVGAVTVNQALMTLLGVPGRQDFYGGGDYALDLRGFGTTSDSNMVVVVDGVRISEADLGGTRLAGIPVNAIDRIEVLRGSAAVLYGEGATAGVINIITRRPAAGAMTLSLGASAGSYDTREGTVHASLGRATERETNKMAISK